VHLPEGRIGNVLCRPVLREYELTYLGRSGAPSDRQIPATDLLVSVVGRDIILHSRQLGKRIVPRLTNAHGFLNLQLAPLYRFLCQLQHQHTSGVPSFQWGPLDSLDFLPRVRCGKVILAPARWQVSREEIDSLGQVEGYRRFLLVQELRRRRNLPRWVVLVESDHYLPTDLDNPLSVDAFVHAAKRGLRAKLQELYPAPDRLCVTGPEGRFYHELDIPFSRRPRKGTNSAGSPIQRDPIQSTAVHRKTRLLPLGSDWLYVKLYAGTATLDDILTTAVPPVIERGLATGVFSRWFFLRYADPQPHLRLRFNGNPDRLAQQFLPLILNQFNPLLDSGRIWKIQFDTYDREVERYGGLEAAIAAEDIFFADSDAALAILQAVPGEDLDTRWQVALLGAHTLLGDCGLDLGARHQLVRGLRDSFHREFQVGIIQKRELGDRFRAERRRLENLIDLSTEPTEILGLARKLFERRSARVVEAVNRLRRIAELGQLRSGIPELATSYVHTHVNRIIRSAARNHEAILYDFLFRLYDGQLARETKAQSPIKHVSSELQ
jgi:thiopeptide-type bacteriocin biosynthesis protein